MATSSISTKLFPPLQQLITAYVGDPHITMSVCKAWKGHKQVIFQAICDSWRRDPVLFGFFPSPNQARFAYDGNNPRTPEKAVEAYIEVRSDPVRCVQWVFGCLMRHLEHNHKPDHRGRVFSQTTVGTLDRTRLTTYLKMRTLHEFIKPFAKIGKLPAADEIVNEGCLRPDAAENAKREGLRKRAEVLNALLQNEAVVAKSSLKIETSFQLFSCLFKQFGLLKNLETLQVSGQRSFALLPRSIGKCAKLKVLNLSGSPEFVGFPKEIGQCKELQSVDLTGTRIARLDELDQCPKLEKIELGYYSKDLLLTPRTVALLERLKIERPSQEKNVSSDRLCELLLPPENMEELDLDELANTKP